MSITVGKNPLEEIEYYTLSTKKSNMQYLGAIWKMIEQFQFIPKANHSASW